MTHDPWNYESRPDLRGKNLTSFVWKHFKRVEENGDVIAVCFYCLQKIVMPISKSTGILRQHLKKHPDKCSSELTPRPSLTRLNKFKTEYYERTVSSIPMPVVRENKKQESISSTMIQKPVTSNKRDYNWDSFQQNVGCAAVSMFQQKKKLKMEGQ